MKHRDIASKNCPMSRSLVVIGERWTLLILRQFFLGLRRFEDIQYTLDIARNILTDRLGKLVDAGILEQRLSSYEPSVKEYRLTQKGHDLYPVIVAILDWGDRYMMGEDGPPVIRIHKSCGHPVDTKFACGHCGEELTARNVELTPGPSAHLGSPLDQAQERLALRQRQREDKQA